MDITTLPFNLHLGIQRAPSDSGSILMLPEDLRYTNHLGTIHASALLSLAEATSGEYLIQNLKDISNIIPVVRRLDAKFKKPGNGKVYSTAKTETGLLEKLKSDLETKGRGMIEVSVDLLSSDRTVLFSSTIEWFIAKQNN